MGYGFSISDIGRGISSGLDSLSGKKGLDEAAQGARDAQTQANALAQLQWERQMAGLNEARGQTQPYLSLYDKIYGTQMAGHQTPVGGMGGLNGAGGVNGTGVTADGKATGNGPYGNGSTVFDHPAPSPSGVLSSGRPAPRATFGEYTIADTRSTPTYAPIMRTSHDATQPSPGSTMTLRPPTQQETLDQLLARLRGGF